jgi:DNA-binding PadR family transcriptional regulator
MLGRPLLPGEFSVLALLLSGPMHGYEMARCFERDDLVEVCPVEQSLLYTYLRNLEDRELVSWQEMREGRRPPRKMYSLTEAGRVAAETWLHEPVGRMRQVRLEFLLKLYFLHHLDVRSEIALLNRQVNVCEAYRARLSERVDCTEGFPRLVANSKLSAAEATLNWLQGYITELKSA